jgi:hypothetical protein
MSLHPAHRPSQVLSPEAALDLVDEPVVAATDPRGVSLMEFHQAVLLLVFGTTVALSVALIPWGLCRENMTSSTAITRFSLPGALCAYLAALVGIAVVGSTALSG